MTNFRVIHTDEATAARKISKGVWFQGPSGITLTCVRCGSMMSIGSYMVQSSGNVGAVQCPVCSFGMDVHLNDWLRR